MDSLKTKFLRRMLAVIVIAGAILFSALPVYAWNATLHDIAFNALEDENNLYATAGSRHLTKGLKPLNTRNDTDKTCRNVCEDVGSLTFEAEITVGGVNEPTIIHATYECDDFLNYVLIQIIVYNSDGDMIHSLSSGLLQNDYTATVYLGGGSYVAEVRLVDITTGKLLMEPYRILFEIGKMPLGVEITFPEGCVYDGNRHPATAEIIEDGLVNGVPAPELTLTYEGEYSTHYGPTTEAPIDAGTYTVTASISDDSNYELQEPTTANFIIAPKEIPITFIMSDDEYQYGDTPEITTELSGLVEGDDPVVTLTYANENYGPSPEPPTNVGTYTVTATGIDNPNYSLPTSPATATFSICPKEITVTITSNGGVYGGTITPAQATLVGLVDEDDPVVTLTYTGTSYSGTPHNTTDVPTKAGSYTVMTAIEDTNYSLGGTTTANFVITPKPISVTIAIPEECIYNGGPHTATPTIVGLLDEDNAVVTLTYANESYGPSTDAPTNVGTYTVTATGISNPNYSLPTSLASATLSICPKEATVTITPNGGVYDGTITPAEATLVGLVDGDDPGVTLTYTGTSYGDTPYNTTEVPTEAGEYTVTANITTLNYSLVGPTSTMFTVAKADYGNEFGRSASCELGTSQGSTASFELPIPPDATYGEVTNTNNFTIATNGSTVTLTTNAGGIPEGTSQMTFTMAVNPDSNHNPYNITVTVTPKYLSEINGVCYLYNVAAEKWLSVDNLNNDMRASLVNRPQPINVEDKGGYTYWLDAYIASSAGNGYFGKNGDDYLMNCAEGTAVSFWPVEGETNAYIIKDADGHVFGYDGSSLLSANATEENASWTLRTRDDLISGLDGATIEDQRDATFLISDPQFGKDNRLFVNWEGSALAKAGSDDNTYASANTTTSGKFNAYQDLGTDVPNGIYELSVQGFYSSTSDKRSAYLYANNEAMALKNISSIAHQPATEEEASAAFTAGKYQCSTLRFVVTNHKIRIGVKGVYEECGWTAFDNFSLMYLGPTSQPNH